MEALTFKNGAKQKTARGKMDFALFAVILVLCVIGLVMVFSASYYSSEFDRDNGLYYVTKQAIYLAVSLPLMYIISFVDFRVLDKFKTVGLVLAIVLLVLVLFIGKKSNGARRWLEIAGISVQPSEFAKFAMILFMSSFMAHRQHLMKSVTKGIVPMLIIMGVICALVMAQPNMSMSVIIGMMGIIMLYMGGADVKYIALLLIAGVLVFILFAVYEPYRMERLISFRDPWKDPQDTGYQLIQSLYALGAGGVFGQGLNNSRQKLLYLTYGESDFVFSIVGEELGFIGAAAVLLLYAFIVYRGIRIALRCKDRFGSLLAAGISVVFALQVLVNIGVVTGAMPTTGQALPFISAGGSSLVIFLSAMGVLLNISRHTADM